MGIKDLSKFLRKEVPQAFQNDIPLNTQGTFICIDVPIFAHKFCYSDNSTANLDKHFRNLVRDLVNIHGFTKIYLVFDGNKTELKERERQKRKEIREKQSKETMLVVESTSDAFMGFEVVDTPEEEDHENPISESQVVFVERVFPTFRDQECLWKSLESADLSNDHFKVILVKATQEAEAMCARLVREGHAHVCLTEDSDSLAFLCPKTILHQRKENQCIVNLEAVLEGLEMSAEKFQDFCILLGCDFAERLPLVGPSKLLSLHKKQPHADLRDCSQNACKSLKCITEHRNQWAFVKQFFQTCGFEMQDN